MASRAYAPLEEETPANLVEASLANRLALLERENSSLKDELSTLKRVRASEPTEDQAKVLVPKRRKSGDQENLPVLRLDDKAKLRLLKKWGSSVGKQSKKEKFYGGSTEVVVEDTIMVSIFQDIFASAGKLIQPTPENKPKSQVTIRMLNSYEDMAGFFGAGNVPNSVECNVWSRGGAANSIGRGFGFGWGRGGAGGFQKSKKLYKSTASVDSLEVQYNKSTMKLQLKFTCSQGSSAAGCYDGDDDY